MNSEWVQCRLGDLVTFQRGYDLPKTKMKSGNYPVVGSNGIIGWHNEYTTENPSITIGRSGNVGNPFVVKSRSWSHNTTLYIKEFKHVDPLFIYYFLKTLNLANFAGGSAVPTLNRNHIHSLPVFVPVSIEKQQKIALILSALDDKIELNQKINENLGRQAQTIFRAWFVDFEPFGGEKPAAWDKATLGTISEISSGKRPPMKQAEKTPTVNIPLVGAASVMGFTNAALYNEKILVTGRVGTHGVIQRFTSKCWASDNTLVITSKFYEFVYQVLQTIDYQNMNRGSTQPLITQTDMKNIPIILPAADILEKFEGTVGTLMRQYEENNRQNAKLAEIRDTLLPKLMSGEIDVSSLPPC